jgi:hypothetical protein
MCWSLELRWGMGVGGRAELQVGVGVRQRSSHTDLTGHGREFRFHSK